MPRTFVKHTSQCIYKGIFRDDWYMSQQTGGRPILNVGGIIQQPGDPDEQKWIRKPAVTCKLHCI
jgi:hypothetical protein